METNLRSLLERNCEGSGARRGRHRTGLDSAGLRPRQTKEQVEVQNEEEAEVQNEVGSELSDERWEKR
jgi:hypothetical protein